MLGLCEISKKVFFGCFGGILIVPKNDFGKNNKIVIKWKDKQTYNLCSRPW